MSFLITKKINYYLHNNIIIVDYIAFYNINAQLYYYSYKFV